MIPVVAVLTLSPLLALGRAEELSAAGGTRFTLNELADDGSYPIDAGVSAVPIDARSRIVLSFDAGQIGRSDNEGRWRALGAVLEEIKELVAQRASANTALTEALGAGDDQIKDARRLANAYNRKFMDFRGRVKTAVGAETFGLIDKAANKRALEKRGGFLAELAEWVSKELKALTPAADAVAERAPEVRVEIAAFLEPAGQERKPLHVENYDQLPEGLLKPVPRTGLQMTSEEQAKLNQDLEYARQAAQSIQEVRQQKDAVIRELMGFRGQLRGRLEQTLAAADEAARRLRERVDRVSGAAGGDQQRAALIAAAPGLATASSSLDAIAASIKGLKEELAGLERLRSYDFAAGIGPALDVFSSSRTLGLLGSLQTDLQALQGQIGPALDQIAIGVKGLPTEQQEAVAREAASLKADITKDALDSIAQLTAMLPVTAQLVTTWGKMFTDAQDQAQASKTLEQNQVPVIQRGLNELLPGTVDLRRSGVKNGDYLTLKVRVRDESGLRLLEEKTHVFQVGSKGWYRDYTGQLLFASPTSGPGRNQFQANVGVLVTWKHGFRKPQGWRKLINGLNPGLGIHATSLHQGTSTVEVGSGLALSLWDDLLTGGFGWNLGVSKDRSYFFVGIGILDLLHKMNRDIQPRK